jgi:hypothetical protein
VRCPISLACRVSPNNSRRFTQTRNGESSTHRGLHDFCLIGASQQRKSLLVNHPSLLSKRLKSRTHNTLRETISPNTTLATTASSRKSAREVFGTWCFAFLPRSGYVPQPKVASTLGKDARMIFQPGTGCVRSSKSTVSCNSGRNRVAVESFTPR